MYKRSSHHDRYFIGVALIFIVLGSAIFALGVVQWLFNLYGTGYAFALPSAKVIGGLVVLALGYIHLELELIRTKE